MSAYAETGAAFVSTPGVDKSKYSIYASGVTALMYRQLRNDQRSFVYEVDPDDVEVAPGSTSAEWTVVVTTHPPASCRERDHEKSEKRLFGEVTAENAPKESPFDVSRSANAVTAGKYGNIVL